MKLLWISNYPLQSIAEAIGKCGLYNEGWKETVARQILDDGEITDFAVAFPGETDDNYTEGRVGELGYFIVPKSKKRSAENPAAVSSFCDILQLYKPDVIHIWGTEFPHTYSAIKACEACGMLGKSVISIQGIASVCAESYEKCLPKHIARRLLIGDLLTGGGIRRAKNELEQRGEFETSALRVSMNVIGRTDFDLAYTRSINEDINYHFCGETLRETFYDGTVWNPDNAGKHILFMSQATYPIKGLHIVLETLGILKKSYPDVMLRIAGSRLIPKDKRKFELLKKFSYNEYIKKKIKKLGLENNIDFIGAKSADEIKSEYLGCSVCISGSVIENSPNSVGEAMLLGVPVVASDVGGTPSVLTHGSDGFLYQYDLPYMAAYYISRLFDDSTLAAGFSKNARTHAGNTHNPEKNYSDLIGIYRRLASAK